MYLQGLTLREFRNYESLRLEVGRGVVIFHGPNGAGKTNLLEAIQVSSTGESPRVREARELVRLGHNYAFVSAEYGGGDGTKLEVGLAETGQRQIKLNGIVRRRADLIGIAPVVYFSAEDIVVLRGEPSGRRRLLDLELSSLSRPYYAQLTRYRRTLEQRNRLLKDLRIGRGQANALDPWDRAAARYGAAVMVERELFLRQLNDAAAQAHARLTGDENTFSLEYLPSLVTELEQERRERKKSPENLIELLVKSLETALQEQRGADLGAGMTTVGPHRDDFQVRLAGRPARVFGSQGQQRIAALATRLGLAAVAEELTRQRPVLLLDDVLSELDERRRAGVFAACRSADQAIITSCDWADIPEEARRESAVFEVSDGRIV